MILWWSFLFLDLILGANGFAFNALLKFLKTSSDRQFQNAILFLDQQQDNGTEEISDQLKLQLQLPFNVYTPGVEGLTALKHCKDTREYAR